MLADKIIVTGFKHLGKHYEFNASPFQKKTFDCSSFIQYIFSVHGIPLPRNSRQQFQVGKSVPFSKIRRGDLLFFTTKKRKKRKGNDRVGHVAIYLGDNKILHTFRQGKKVQVSTLDGHWSKVYLGARRVI